ncbi:MAG: hypothetical protein M5U34_14405 [Chloroflexi bacterium]|nr:hypothetical protein [Chloroflexota bacterium]
MVLKDSSVKSTLSILALLSVTLTIMLMFQPTHANPDDVVEVTNEWNGHTQISNSEYGARKPVIRFSPVSNRALLIYDQWNSIGGNKDPYYALSSDGGASWSAGQSVAVTAVGSSDQAVGLLDYQDAGFAFWVENSPGIASTLVFFPETAGQCLDQSDQH